MFRSLFVSGLLTCNGSCSESICPCKPLRSCLRFLAVCYGVGYAVHVYILVVYLSMNWASSLVPHIPFPHSKPLLTNIVCKRSHIIEGEVRLWCWHCGFFFFFWGGIRGEVERFEKWLSFQKSTTHLWYRKIWKTFPRKYFVLKQYGASIRNKFCDIYIIVFCLTVLLVNASCIWFHDNTCFFSWLRMSLILLESFSLINTVNPAFCISYHCITWFGIKEIMSELLLLLCNMSDIYTISRNIPEDAGIH